MSEPQRITVVCDDPRHGGKGEVVIDRLELHKGKVVRSQERHHARTPAHSREDVEWERVRLRCELCGTDVPLRQDNAVRLVRGLLEVGVSSVRLADLIR